MKTIILLFLPFISLAQFDGKNDGFISIQMRVGCSATLNSPFIALAPVFSAHGFNLVPELWVNAKDNEAVNMGLKISYKYNFIEAGYGRYAVMYSMDGVNNHGQANGWGNLWFAELHYKQFFFEYDYLKGSRFGIGVREDIFNLQ